MRKSILAALVLVSGSVFAGPFPGMLPPMANAEMGPTNQIEVVGSAVFCQDCFGKPFKLSKVRDADGFDVVSVNETRNWALIAEVSETCPAGNWAIINKRGNDPVAEPMYPGTCEEIAAVEIRDINNYDAEVIMHTVTDHVVKFKFKGK